jgi:hypothetical protein
MHRDSDVLKSANLANFEYAAQIGDLSSAG